MKAALLIILLASICLLLAGADIPVYPVDVYKLSGKWYPIAAVLKNREPKNTIPVDNTVEPIDDKDFILKMRYIQDRTCREIDIQVLHTDESGIYKVPATGETVYMVSLDYGSFHIVHVDGNGSYGLYLLSRTRGASEYVKTKFRELAETLGYDVTKIIYESLAESCQ